MSDLDTIVTVNITAATRTPTAEGFGTPCILTYHTVWLDEYRVYSSAADMLTDGFNAYDNAYRMAVAVFSQSPSPAQIVVGRLPAAPVFAGTLTVTTATAGKTISCSVIRPTDGVVVPISRTVPGASSTTAEATAVAALIAAVTGVTATAVGAVITWGATTAGERPFFYNLQNLTYEETTAAAGYDTELTSLTNIPVDWYWPLIDSSSPANVAAVAAIAGASSHMLYAVQTQSAALLAGTDTTFTALKTAVNKRVAPFYFANAHEFGDCAIAGLIAAQTPGSITSANKTLTGVSAYRLTSTQGTNLKTANVSYYVPIAGLNVTQGGKVSSGEWIDVIHGIDALKSAIQISVFTLIANRDKVPYSQPGFNLIESSALSAIRTFEDNPNKTALLEEGTGYVTMPDIDTVPSADKQNRVLNGVLFGGVLSGAIHGTVLTGTLTNS